MLMKFGYKTYVSGTRSTNGTSLYYSKIFYNLEVLTSLQRQVGRTRSSRDIKSRSNSPS
jgi:hypothetical protein